MHRSKRTRVLGIGLATGLATLALAGPAAADPASGPKGSNENASCIGRLAGGELGAKSDPGSAARFVAALKLVSEAAGEPYGRLIVSGFATGRNPCPV